MKKLLLTILFILITTLSYANDESSSSSIIQSIIPMIIFFIVIYFLLIRPQIKRNKEQTSMIKNIKSGDEVIINHSIIGKIIKIGENYTEIQISEKTIVKIQKNAISKILPKGTIKLN